ncbi:hypothetical protein, partial [Klebsiella pneumoniae]|uniref:hypothetical protein n=1 Tax=Klebsiella pneumoniae TaxID=573 RepID=UPI003EDEE660
AAQKRIATARIKDAGPHDAATEAGSDHPSPEQIAAVDLLPSHLESWKGKNIQFLVATLPDPVDSGLAYDFDQDLEALQLAIVRGGRLRDRSWL